MVLSVHVRRVRKVLEEWNAGIDRWSALSEDGLTLANSALNERHRLLRRKREREEGMWAYELADVPEQQGPSAQGEGPASSLQASLEMLNRITSKLEGILDRFFALQARWRQETATSLVDIPVGISLAYANRVFDRVLDMFLTDLLCKRQILRDLPSIQSKEEGLVCLSCWLQMPSIRLEPWWQEFMHVASSLSPQEGET